MKAMTKSIETTIYFGFALADSMFDGSCEIARRSMQPEEVRALAEAGKLTPCLNPSHAATIAAMRCRFGIEVEIPQMPPQVKLGLGDRLVVMGVRGLPRLTDRHEYSEEEIASATFTFSEYEVQALTGYIPANDPDGNTVFLNMRKTVEHPEWVVISEEYPE